MMDPHLKKFFPKPPMIAFIPQRNTRDFLMRSRVFPKTGSYSKRFL